MPIRVKGQSARVRLYWSKKPEKVVTKDNYPYQPKQKQKLDK